VDINKATVTGSPKDAVPKKMADGFTDRAIIEITEDYVNRKMLRTTDMYYFFTVKDFNLDSKPDFAFIGDLGYHSSPVKYYVWVNIKDKFVYWHNLSGTPSETEDSARRIVNIITANDNGQLKPNYYRVEKDTVLVPVRR
jgi:hypothetical protein